MTTRELKYGFRHDPMEWVENDGSLQAALVRKLVLDRASEGDEETIESHFRETFAKQSPDGSLEDEHDQAHFLDGEERVDWN